LVRSDRHSDLVTHSKEQLTAHWLSESHLSNDFIEALAEELLTHWANSTVASLALHQLLVKLFTKARNIDS
jgi:hypothetical protein